MFLLFLKLPYSVILLNFLYLHSNMFLLFRHIIDRLQPSGSDLHSNMFLLFPESKLHKINFDLFTFQYVSIISYESKSIKYVVKRFTFQYVSIISDGLAAGTYNVTLFTFQYVSIISYPYRSFSVYVFPIYIPICFYYFWKKNTCSQWKVYHLHSNMFLLFPSIQSTIKFGSISFTFQYVSIISRPM